VSITKAKIIAVCIQNQVRDPPIIMHLRVGFVILSTSPSNYAVTMTTRLRISTDGPRCICGCSCGIDLSGITSDVPQGLQVLISLPSSSACRQGYIPHAKIHHAPLLAGCTSSGQPRRRRPSDPVKHSLAMSHGAAPWQCRDLQTTALRCSCVLFGMEAYFPYLGSCKGFLSFDIF